MGAAPATTAAEPQPSKIHKVRITGLQPDTVYAYKVRSGSEEAFEAEFKTAPAVERPIAFAVIGDSRRWEERWQETEMGRHLMQWEPEFVLNMRNGYLEVQKDRNGNFAGPDGETPNWKIERGGSWPIGLSEPLDATDEQVLDVVKVFGPISANQVCVHLGGRRAVVYRTISRLANAGAIEKVSGKWREVEEA